MKKTQFGHPGDPTAYIHYINTATVNLGGAKFRERQLRGCKFWRIYLHIDTDSKVKYNSMILIL